MIKNIALNRRKLLKTVLLLFLQFKVSAANFLIKKEKIKIIFGSCSNQKKNMFHWKQIVSYSPDFIFLLGDNVYGDFFNEKAEELIRAYKKLNRDVAFKYLKNNVPILPIWDDHDYGENDGGKTWVYKDISKKIFLDFFNIPMNDVRRSREGIYKSSFIETNKKKIKVIALDTRYFRDDFKYNINPNINKKYIADLNPHKSILGKEQWQWFLDELKGEYDFLIVLSSYQVLSKSHGWEKWDNFPLERNRILYNLGLINKPILILSGDRHIGGIYKSKDNKIFEATSSSFNQKTFNFEEEDLLRVSKLIKKNNFGLLEIDNKGVNIKIISGFSNKNIQYAYAKIAF